MGERVSLKDVMTETPTSSRSPVFLITCAILLGAVLSGCTNSLPLDTPWNTPVGAVNASWTAVGQPGFTPGSANRVNIGFTPDGTLLASFSDQIAGNNASVEAYNGSAWTFVGVEGFSSVNVDFVALAIGANGTPYVAYQDNYNTLKRATVMSYSGGAWNLVGAQQFTPGEVDDVSLAIDGTGTPVIAFVDKSVIPSPISVWRYTAGAWAPLPGGADISGGTNADAHPSIAYDSSGNLYVAYTDGDTGGKLAVRCFNGSTWAPVGPVPCTPSSAGSPSLKIGPGNIPYVAFQDGAAGNNGLTVMKYAGASWSLVGPRGFSPGGTGAPSLGISTGGTLYVGFRDTVNGNKATVMKFTGTTWIGVGTVGLSAGSVGSVSLGLDPGGTPFLGYKDGANGNAVTVMEYH